MASKSGLGSTTLWGLTPSINLLSLIDEQVLLASPEHGIHILLLGQADLRHVLRTLSDLTVLGLMGNTKIHFYVIESSMELYARQLLFLLLAHTSTAEIGLYEKTKQFLELYGNTNLRPRTKNSLVRMADFLISLITDEDLLKKALPMVSISELKFQERDDLTQIFKYWAKYCDEALEDMSTRWNKRIRYHLGSRYDSREGIFDWQYYMGLLYQPAASIIHANEYKKWRRTGMAFVEFESEYTQPNVTLNTGAAQTTNVRDVVFAGEIVTGPYIAHGLYCDDLNMLKKVNRAHKHTAAEISAYNIGQIMERLSNFANDHSQGDGAENGPPVLANYSVTFLPVEAAKSIFTKTKYKNKFHLVYFSNTMAQHLTSDAASSLTENAKVVVESVRFLLELRKEHVQEYNDKVGKLAESAGFSKCEEGERLAGSDYHVFKAVVKGPDSPEQTTEVARCLEPESISKQDK